MFRNAKIVHLSLKKDPEKHTQEAVVSFQLNCVQGRLAFKLFVCLSVQKNRRRGWSINYGGENGLRNVGNKRGLFCRS